MSLFPLKKQLQKGQTLLEYTFIIPVFLMFICIMVEASFAFIQSQRVMAVSRELAGSAFRDCTTAINPTTCANDLADKMFDGANVLLPSFNTKGGFWLHITFPTGEARPTIPISKGVSFTSTYNEMDFTVIKNAQGHGVMSEVTFSYQPVTPFGKILGVVIAHNSMKLYATTVY